MRAASPWPAGGGSAPRTVRDILVRNATPAEAERIFFDWLGQNRIPVLDARSDGSEKVLPSWQGALVLHPTPGSLVALEERPGGATIVFEASVRASPGGSTIHLEGYTTGRGYPWKGKEYDFVASAMAMAGIPRKRGLALLGEFEGYVRQFGGAPPPPPLPLSSGGVGSAPPTIGSPLATNRLSKEAQRAKDRTSQRRLAYVAYGGLAIFILGFVGSFALDAVGDRSAGGAWIGLSFLGLPLVAAGGFGMLSLAHRRSLTPLDTNSAPLAGLDPYYGSVPWTPPAVPSVALGELPPSRSFDLTAAAAAYHKRMRSRVRMRQALYGFLIASGAVAIVVSYFRGTLANGLGFGGAFIAFGVILLFVIRQIDSAPVRVTVDGEGLLIEFPKSKRTVLRWTDPKFGMILSTTSAEVNRNMDPPVDGPTFTLFTGAGSGVGSGPRVFTKISNDCFDLVIRRAQIAGLPVQPKVEGVPGTISERLTYRILPLSQRGFGP